MRRRDPFDFGLIEGLSNAGEELPRRLELEILAYGEVAVEPLCELLGNGDWGELHAVQLIRALGAEPAVEALIAVLADCEPLDCVHDEICETLTDLGSRVVEPALEALSRAGGGWYRRVLLGVLAYTPAGNDAVRAALERVLDEDPVYGAGLLAEYGDEKALEALAQALDSFELVQESGLFANRAAVELVEAILTLGGDLTAVQKAKLRDAAEMRGTWLASRIDPPAAPVVRAPQRPGRNEPCRCGSGKKYKRCHLQADQLALA